MTPQVQQILKDMKSQDSVKDIKDVPVVKEKKVPAIIPTIQADALTKDARVEEEIKEEVKEDPNTFHMSQGYPLKK
jgi:hypothetical protein